jgi:2-keto-3-deoxy-L-rhamnonate aldolase RhmA
MDGGSFKQRVQAREPVLGTFLQLGSPLATEIVGQAGFDWVLVDCKHGAGKDPLIRQLQAPLGVKGIVGRWAVAW